MKYQIKLLRNQNRKVRVVNAEPEKIVALVMCPLKTNAGFFFKTNAFLFLLVIFVKHLVTDKF